MLPDQDTYPLSSMLSPTAYLHSANQSSHSREQNQPLGVKPGQYALAGRGVDKSSGPYSSSDPSSLPDEMQLPAGGAGDGLICVVTVPGIVREPGRYMNPLVGASE